MCLEVIHEAYGILTFALEIGIGENVGTRVPEVMPLLEGRTTYRRISGANDHVAIRRG